MPVPFGLVGTFNYHVTGFKGREIAVDAYYSTIQLGFSNSAYGNIFNLVTRSAGRDIWSGLGIQIGSKSILRKPEPFEEEGEVPTEVPFSVFGILLRYGNNYEEGVSWIYATELVGGVLTAKDPFTGSSQEAIYGKLLGSIGLRIPIKNNGLSIGVRGGLEGVPPDTFARYRHAESELVFGIAAFASFGLNLEK